MKKIAFERVVDPIPENKINIGNTIAEYYQQREKRIAKHMAMMMVHPFELPLWECFGYGGQSFFTYTSFYVVINKDLQL